ncbi:MAG TPA: L-lactate permease [Bryobacteraceae bacterium]|jgi:lactate permease|nr:L-lactate permease [Bryobacteraceae bacterium]
MHWTQQYTPAAGSLALSALVAALPVVVLLGLLAFGHVKAHWAALSGLAASLLVAVMVFGMPAPLAGAAALMGAAYGLFPIGWIVLGAIFVYDVTVKSGDFEIVKDTISGLGSDRRIQVLLIAFCFGAFIEGAAGFGTPVAISAAMLIGLGFRPLQAAGLALIANTAPVAFGALGIPIITLSTVTGLPVDLLSAMCGRILVLFCIAIPFWVVWAMCGRKKMMEVWPACLTAGLTYGIVQYAISNYVGASLVAIFASVSSMLALVILLKFWQPAKTWSFEHEDAALRQSEHASRRTYTGGRKLKAWMPWILLSVFVFAWGLTPVKTFLNGGTAKEPNFLSGISSVSVNVPLLHKAITRTPPVVSKPAIEGAVFTFNWASATGTSLILAGVVGGMLLGFTPANLILILWGTLKRIRKSLLTIAAMLALGYSTRYAGLDATMGLAFASTGVLFPFFSPLLGWLGVALTGSDTSSNVLFGGLQQITARQVGVAPVLAAAANSAGGVMGKMIDAQSIVVAGVATGQQGNEGNILRYVFLHSIVLAALVGVVVFLMAYVFPWMIPVVAK